MAPLGIRWTLGVDGISLFMVALTALLFPIGLLRVGRASNGPKAFIAWMLLLEAALIGVFLALDLILFFVFFEVVLVPMYFLIAGWGHGNRALRGDEVLPVHDGRLGVPARRHPRRWRSCTAAPRAASRSTCVTLAAAHVERRSSQRDRRSGCSSRSRSRSR